MKNKFNFGPYQCKTSCLFLYLDIKKLDWKEVIPLIWNFDFMYDEYEYIVGAELPQNSIKKINSCFGLNFKEENQKDFFNKEEKLKKGWRIISTDMFNIPFSNHYLKKHYEHFVLINYKNYDDIDFYDPLLNLQTTINEKQIKSYLSNYSTSNVLLLGDNSTKKKNNSDIRTELKYKKFSPAYFDLILFIKSIKKNEDDKVEFLLQYIAHLPTIRKAFFELCPIDIIYDFGKFESDINEVIQYWWRILYFLSKLKSKFDYIYIENIIKQLKKIEKIESSIFVFEG